VNCLEAPLFFDCHASDRQLAILCNLLDALCAMNEGSCSYSSTPSYTLPCAYRIGCVSVRFNAQLAAKLRIHLWDHRRGLHVTHCMLAACRTHGVSGMYDYQALTTALLA
jgi:hypothetical protein